ncbi:isochorismatase family cysteine hydrolase [Clostridium estertheticum]|uniref:Amidase n=2 Tax=Clostridium estertheticum TaxID=238834 RepID=A0A1J0GDT5_9CLOT|nr:isochorismatase family cysteine hydrolase [Clostridium estertheticum]APC39451.1 amidase [Clostridium estertheticum subsp. estertheticum]MBU3072128.1 cysteine hydrolase [Clostridium estertheticum]MBU3162220.1 cysteine hydrolase [Clostridium estertheticum]MBU3170651.1 cysteine hydrolase [Clostridium estertheticum]MBU3184720.1 cysteine hydrolase [Clostridium estertheticum]
MINLLINKIFDMQNEIKGNVVNLNDLPKEKTALIVMDMVNGFVHAGIMSSPRVETIIDNVVAINERTYGYKKVFFLEQHDENSTEFKIYGRHCLKNSTEAELISSLNCGATLHSNTTIIHKNSTNGFHAPEFKTWLHENEAQIENYIVEGCSTDICVKHFTETLKTYFNEKNIDRRIIVPIDSVETFDTGTHDGDLMKVISLWEMKSNGIEVVDTIL